MEADNESWVSLSENGSAHFNASNLGFLNASPPVGPWGDAQDKEVTRLEEILHAQETAYKNFTITIQAFILIGSLLGKWTSTRYKLLHCIFLIFLMINNDILHYLGL